ncbi:MAG: hypothetical protein K9N09_04120 [Candidatus Cloacimonetes bacterium]|nr:hypothetical protein [Candidatus Cloacimonadota bacterium]MCF7814473.1 hypothetical protein [Candidatus Cloacimonadota bacterium]MCF7867865.1 hypothetical protein [Candidatus Cloacimonadota bacterium]MCF7883684.1 hypothetical protein [Candidatus Cloacimonadota bacterium]
MKKLATSNKQPATRNEQQETSNQQSGYEVKEKYLSFPNGSLGTRRNVWSLGTRRNVWSLGTRNSTTLKSKV